jgi:hypothetical protein
LQEQFQTDEAAMCAYELCAGQSVHATLLCRLLKVFAGQASHDELSVLYCPGSHDRHTPFTIW